MHSEFRLNHINYSKEELLALATDNLQNQAIPDWERALFLFIKEWFDEKKFVGIQTSGSTGKPKRIELPKTSMLQSAKNTVDFFSLNSECNALLCLPVKYIAGKMMVLRALISGMNLLTAEPKASPEIPPHTSVHFTAMTPMQLDKLFQQTKFQNPEKIILGGSPVNSILANKIADKGIQAWETYGMTETASHIALRKVNSQNYFTALNGIKLRKNDDNCLVISANYLPQQIITNDVVELIAPNKFRIIGRSDIVINSGGIKIHPEKIEHDFYTKTQIPIVISSKPNETLGEMAVMLVEQKNCFLKSALKTLLSQIENGQYIKEVVQVKEFPLTENGKIDRLELKKLLL